jgi:hypothetical protein
MSNTPTAPKLELPEKINSIDDFKKYVKALELLTKFIIDYAHVLDRLVIIKCHDDLKMIKKEMIKVKDKSYCSKCGLID